jgi:flagellar biosynthesis/type III secretory pathway protein FliH
MSSSEPRASRAPRGFVDVPAAPVRAFVELPLQLTRAAEHAARAGSPGQRDDAALLAQAAERGRAEGFAEAEARHAAHGDAALRALADGARALAAREERALAEWPRRALALAAEIAERVLRRSLAEDLARLTPCLDEALATLAPRGPVALALSPAALAALRAGSAAALAAWAEAAGVALQADASLAPSEATLAAGPARVELRWNAVVEQLRSTLEECLSLADVTS